MRESILSPYINLHIEQFSEPLDSFTCQGPYEQWSIFNSGPHRPLIVSEGDRQKSQQLCIEFGLLL